MDRQMQLYWEAFNELVTTDEIVKYDFNPVFQFDDEMVDGAIVDIGCGQTSALLRYVGLTRAKLIGIDNDTYQLERLMERLTEVAGDVSDDWDLLDCDIQNDTLPDGAYSVVILYNILHFFTLEECRLLIDKIEDHINKGSMISVCVHSIKYWANDPTDKNNNDYFKHYFSSDDLDQLFPADKYENVYNADIERKHVKKDKEVSALWAEKIIANLRAPNEAVKADIRRHVSSTHLDAELIHVYRKY